MGPGTKVDLYYYAESDHVRSITGTIIDTDSTWVILTDVAGMERAFPITSIQQMIKSD